MSILTYSGILVGSDQYFITKEPRMEDDDDFHSNVTFINQSNGLIVGPFKILDDFIKCNFRCSSGILCKLPETSEQREQWRKQALENDTRTDTT